MFNPLGEHRDGPGERGMDALPIRVAGGRVTIVFGEAPVRGQPVGGVVVDRPPSGPHCVGPGEH
jgi:hypothetical protein